MFPTLTFECEMDDIHTKNVSSPSKAILSSRMAKEVQEERGREEEEEGDELLDSVKLNVTSFNPATKSSRSEQ